MNRNKQQGVVIVVALFIVALVAAMSFVMMSRLERDTRRAQLIVRNAQAQFYAQGSVTWAMDQLLNDWENKKDNEPVDLVPIQSPTNVVNGYHIKSTITDMQALYNLNNLSDSREIPTFKRLLHSLLPDINEQKSEALAQAIINWVNVTPDTKFNNYYLKLPEPYRTAHHLMISTSELLLVKGFTPEIYKKLGPYITALPKYPTEINVQTASVPVLQTVSEKINKSLAEEIVLLRLKKPFTNTRSFFERSEISKAGLNANSVKVTTQSDYFLVETKVSIENQEVVFYTLLERTSRQKDNEAQVNIIWQSKGYM